MSRFTSLRSPWVLPLCLGLGACATASLDDRGLEDWTPPPEARVCVGDPDAYIGGDPSRVECPEYWVCEDLAYGGKRCTNPGPDYPGDGSWECRDEDGTTICEGDSFPDDGGGGQWDCRSEGDLVICRDDTPDTPDDGSGGGWDCFYVDEFRVCDDGGSGGGGSGGGGSGGGGGSDGSDGGDGGDDICFYPADDPSGGVIVRGGHRFETLGGRDVIHVTLFFSEAFVDNTYGANSSDGYRGGGNGHRFRDLVSSDHAEVGFRNGAGAEVLRAKFDYFSGNDAMASGYGSLGVSGGDGRMISGDPAVVVAASSSLDRNFNERGCIYTEDSPGPGECAGWDNQVVYEMWLDASAFDGFGGPTLEYVHASPSRTDDTIFVRSDDCP